MLTRSLARMLPLTLPRTTTDFADNCTLTLPVGPTVRTWCRSSNRPVDLAVDDEVLAPLDIALDDDSPPDPGDALGSLRAASTLSARRRRTADRSIVSKRCLDHFEATSIHPGDPFMRRRRPLLHPRSAPPAPSGTTSAAPTRTPGTRPLGNHPSSSSRSNRHRCPFSRRGHAGTTNFCSGISPVGASRTPRPAGGPGPPRQPACRRPATGRRRRTPHSRAPRGPPDPATGTPTTPTAAAGPPPDRVQIVHQRH